MATADAPVVVRLWECVLVLMLSLSTVFILWSKMKLNRIWHTHTYVGSISSSFHGWCFSSGLAHGGCLSYNIRGLVKGKEGVVVVVWSLSWLSGLVEVTQGRHVALPPSPSSSHFYILSTLRFLPTYCSLCNSFSLLRQRCWFYFSTPNPAYVLCSTNYISHYISYTKYGTKNDYFYMFRSLLTHLNYQSNCNTSDT